MNVKTRFDFSQCTLCPPSIHLRISVCGDTTLSMCTNIFTSVVHIVFIHPRKIFYYFHEWSRMN